MPHHITSVVEIREAGIMLRPGRRHVIRVLGALKEIPLPTGPILWVGDTGRGDPAIYEDYHAGKIAGPQEDPTAQPLNPTVPSLFITRTGDAEFLERDVG